MAQVRWSKIAISVVLLIWLTIKARKFYSIFVHNCIAKSHRSKSLLMSCRWCLELVLLMTTRIHYTRLRFTTFSSGSQNIISFSIIFHKYQLVKTAEQTVKENQQALFSSKKLVIVENFLSYTLAELKQKKIILVWL